MLCNDWARVDGELYLTHRRKSRGASALCQGQLGRVDRPPVVQVHSCSHGPSLAVYMTCWDSSPGISTVMRIQSCQVVQLWGKAQEGFMGCSGDFVTLFWEIRCLWNRASQCGKREEALTFGVIENILPLPRSIRDSMASITYRKKRPNILVQWRDNRGIKWSGEGLMP